MIRVGGSRSDSYLSEVGDSARGDPENTQSQTPDSCPRKPKTPFIKEYDP